MEISSVGRATTQAEPQDDRPPVSVINSIIGRHCNEGLNENEELVKKEELTLSWSADHRVVDGAECARCAEKVRGYLEDPASLLVGLR